MVALVVHRFWAVAVSAAPPAAPALRLHQQEIMVAVVAVVRSMWAVLPVLVVLLFSVIAAVRH
jgi:hypothetical protein